MKAYVKALSIMQIAFIAGLTIFALIIMFLIKTGAINRGSSAGPAIRDLPDYFLYITLGLVAAIIIASAAVFKAQVTRASGLNNPADRLVAYRSAFIRRIFIPELSAILSIIITMLSQDLKYLSLVGLVLLAFLAWFPTADKVMTALSITESDFDH